MVGGRGGQHYSSQGFISDEEHPFNLNEIGQNAGLNEEIRKLLEENQRTQHH